MKKVFKNILYELDKEKYADIHNARREEKHLTDELIDFLMNKRYICLPLLLLFNTIFAKTITLLCSCIYAFWLYIASPFSNNHIIADSLMIYNVEVNT
jgi:hypothetical protein